MFWTLSFLSQRMIPVYTTAKVTGFPLKSPYKVWNNINYIQTRLLYILTRSLRGLLNIHVTFRMLTIWSHFRLLLNWDVALTWVVLLLHWEGLVCVHQFACSMSFPARIYTAGGTTCFVGAAHHLDKLPDTQHNVWQLYNSSWWPRICPILLLHARVFSEKTTVTKKTTWYY